MITYRDKVFMSFMILFGIETLIISFHLEPIKAAPWYFWATYPFAVLMGARTIVHYYVMDWFRQFFVHLEPDSSNAGKDNQPNEGKIHPFGELVACPVCTGTHFASLLMTVYCLFPNLGLAAVILLGFAGINPLLYWLNELLSWSARAARVYSGQVSPDPDTAEYQLRHANRISALAMIKEVEKEQVK
jgi:hypothetical protein